MGLTHKYQAFFIALKAPIKYLASISRIGYHPNAHVDFLLFNKLDKLPVLAIEVDDYSYNQ